MAIELHCLNGHALRVADSAAGKRVRCPTCQEIVTVGDESSATTRHNARDSSGSGSRTGGAGRSTNLPAKSNRPAARGRRTAGSGSSGKLIIAASGVAAAVVVGLVVLLVLRPGSASTATPTEVSAVPYVETTAPAVAATVSVAETSTPAVASELQPVAAVQADEPTTVATPVAVAAASETAATEKQEPPVAKAASASGSEFVVWDTGDSTPVVNKGNLVDRGAAWIHIAQDASASHAFGGGCVIENGTLWLHIPQDASTPVQITARQGSGPEAVVPITIVGGESKPAGTRVIRIEQLSDNSAVVTWSGEGPSVACRVEQGKSWVEVLPRDRAEQLAIGVAARYVVVPTEFGEDAILDSSIPTERRTIPLPRENMVLALQPEGHFITVLTFPSIDQAGEVTLGSSGGGAGKLVNRVSAKFKDQSVFVGVLPQRDMWFSEGVGKKYSASGQYPIGWKPPCAGVWRIAGRIQGKYFVSEVPHDRFIFACSQSGTLECLFGFLSRPLERAADDAVTPMTIYRETLGGTEGQAYLVESDTGDPIPLRLTKYRDVCNSIDDIKDVWRNSPNELKSDPGYVPNLLADCQSIIGRMDSRLREYADLTEHVGEVVAQIDAGNSGTADAGLKAFRKTVDKCAAMLRAQPRVPTDKVDPLVAEIKSKSAVSFKGRLNVTELDTLAEHLRDVASQQEVQLKKLRVIALELSEACGKQRTTASASEPQSVTAIGRHCRKVLRTRDVEE